MTQDPNSRRDDILGILKRQEVNGIPHISEAEIGRELHLEATQVADVLRSMQQEGHVSRTGDGNWELTPAMSSQTIARPDPKEPL